MEKARKESWLTALRSGDYTQGQMVLKTPASSLTLTNGEIFKQELEFCCLGVLCEISPDLFRWSEEKGYVLLADEQYVFDTDFSDCPKEHRVIDSKLEIPLVNMNDGTEDVDGVISSFEEIADWIELNVPAE